MASFFNSLGQVFGLTKPKNQGGYYGEQIKRPSDIEWGRQQYGKLSDILGGIGTGYTPEMMDVMSSPWAQAGQRSMRETQANIGARASAGGLGRSSLVSAQGAQAGTDLANQLAQIRSGLAQQSENQRIAQQGQALGLRQNLIGEELNQQNLMSQAQRQEMLRQQGYREAADQSQQAGALRGLLTLLGGVGGFAGAIPGLAGGMGGGLTGALTGLTGGQFGQFQKTPMFGGMGTDTNDIDTQMAEIMAELNRRNAAQVQK